VQGYITLLKAALTVSVPNCFFVLLGTCLKEDESFLFSLSARVKLYIIIM